MREEEPVGPSQEMPRNSTEAGSQNSNGRTPGKKNYPAVVAAVPTGQTFIRTWPTSVETVQAVRRPATKEDCLFYSSHYQSCLSPSLALPWRLWALYQGAVKDTNTFWSYATMEPSTRRQYLYGPATQKRWQKNWWLSGHSQGATDGPGDELHLTNCWLSSTDC